MRSPTVSPVASRCLHVVREPGERAGAKARDSFGARLDFARIDKAQGGKELNTRHCRRDRQDV